MNYEELPDKIALSKQDNFECQQTTDTKSDWLFYIFIGCMIAMVFFDLGRITAKPKMMIQSSSDQNQLYNGNYQITFPIFTTEQLRMLRPNKPGIIVYNFTDKKLYYAQSQKVWVQMGIMNPQFNKK